MMDYEEFVGRLTDDQAETLRRDNVRRYEFKIYLVGYGDDEADAWRDACESFWDDPGAPPGEEDITVEEIED
jgi:hypothetical protein